MIYVMADDYLVNERIVESLSRKQLESKVVSFFFPYIKRENYITVWQINKEDCEMVVLSVKDKKNRQAAVKLLLSNGIQNDKIYDFKKVYEALIPKCFVDRIMAGKLGKPLDGIVLGISHGQVAVNTDYMEHNFANFACSHQDLYYDIQTLKYAKENYAEEFKSIKYVVIDMFDYYYINYDTSLSKFAHMFARSSGTVLGPHHYDKNTRMQLSWEELKNSLYEEWYKDITEEEVDTWDRLFSYYFEAEDYCAFINSVDDKVMDDSEIDRFGLGGSAYNMHEATIDENVGLLEELVKEIKEINSDISIVFILVPRYKEIEEEEKNDEMQALWKSFFYKCINRICNKYGTVFLDFKENGGISDIKEFYSDVAHLNREGAALFTHYLENILYEGK